MIFYFSGTGNSKWVAECLSKNLDERVCSIAECSLLGEFNFKLAKGEKVVFVFPIYAWRAPQIVIDFAKKIAIEKTDVSIVATCGQDTGKALESLKKVFEKKGHKVKNLFAVVMPNNYCKGADLEGEEEVKEIIKDAKPLVDIFAKEIKSDSSGRAVPECKGARFKTYVIGKLFNKFARSTEPFFATDKCDGCGLCEKNCPIKIITLNGKPTWNKPQCTGCLSCLNRCPKGAIEFGKQTIGRKRYYFRESNEGKLN